ncbi:MAG TPA: hypothetical protein VFE47_05245 [Tepidisphaeraceae bacterium]|nr:hypothetical protein [Tepidisphaeraceae bacterium]
MAEEQTDAAPETETSIIGELMAELDAFEPTDDSVDNEERLQIWVDRWEEAPDKELALPSILGVFERYPDNSGLGEPGPLVHAVEQIPDYEQALSTSLETSPSYYGVWMVNRILGGDLPADVRTAWLDVLRRIAQSETAPPSVAATAQEFLGFQEG